MHSMLVRKPWDLQIFTLSALRESPTATRLSSALFSLCAGVLLATGGGHIGSAYAQLTPNTCYDVDNSNAGGIIDPPGQGASSPLNCTANDISFSNVVFTPLDGCINEADTATFTISGDASSTALRRLDLGYWINGKGGDAELDPGTVGDECQVMYLTPTNAVPYIPGRNSCGDVPQQPASTTITFDELTVDCLPSDATACATAGREFVSFHTMTVYENNQNAACASLEDALTPGTTSKCLSGCSVSTTAIPALSLTKECIEPATNVNYAITGNDFILYPGDKLVCEIIVDNAEFLSDGVSPAGAAERIYVYDFFPAIFQTGTGSVGLFNSSQGSVDGPDTTGAYDGGALPNPFKKENSFLWYVGDLNPGTDALLVFEMMTDSADPGTSGGAGPEFTCNSAILALDNPGPAPVDESTTTTTPGPDQRINLWADNPAPDPVGSNDPVAGRGVIGELQPDSITEVGGCKLTRAAISDFSVSDAGGVNAIRWRTSSEEGTLGFHVERLDPASGEYVRLNGELLPANIAAPQGSNYQFVDDAVAGKATYRLVEVESVGRQLVHGPFEADKADSRNSANALPAAALQMQGAADVTAEGGKFKATGRQRSERMQQRLDKQKQELRGKGARKSSSIEQPEQGFSVAGLLRQGANALLEAIIPSANAADAMKVEVGESRIYRITAQEIADVFGVTASSIRNRIKSADLKLASCGEEVAWQRDNRNDTVWLYGQALTGEDALYASSNVYWLTLEAGTVADSIRSGSRLRRSSSSSDAGTGLRKSTAAGSVQAGARPPISAPGAPLSTFRETTNIEQENKALIQFPQADGDFWFWGHLTGSTGEDFAFDSPGAAGSGRARLTLRLRGTSITDDNRVDVAVNGVNVGAAQWLGAGEKTVTATFAGSLLRAGGNTLTLSPASGAAFTYVLFDGLVLEYDRRYVADNDFLEFPANGNTEITLTGFTSKAISVSNVTDPATPRRFIRLKALTDGSGGWRVTIKADPGAKYVAYANGAEEPAAATAYSRQDVLAGVQNADYIVIASEQTKSGGQAMADYRQGKGHQTAVVTFEQIVDELHDGIPTPWAVRDFLQQAWTVSGGKTKYALIAGAGNYDYRDLLADTAGTNLVPPPMVRNRYGVFGADMLSGDVEGYDGIPEIATGRVPAFTNAELLAYRDKLQASEDDHDGWAERALWIADDAEEFGRFDTNSDRATADVPRYVNNVKAYLNKPHSAAEVKQLITAEINNGVSIAYYLGHGAADHLATEHIYDSADVDTLSNAELPVFVGLTCSIARFDIPGYESLGMALVMKAGGGASTVWAPTSLSNDHWATGVGQEFLRAVFRRGKQTVGEAVVAALREQGADSDLLSSHKVSQILGDPAATIR